MSQAERYKTAASQRFGVARVSTGSVGSAMAGKVKISAEQALRHRAQTGQTSAAPESLAPPEGLIGRSRAMLGVYEQIAHASASEATVLITGATRADKELVTQAVHRHSARAVNCGALAEGLLASQLFGHVRGSFTGAVAEVLGVDRRTLYRMVERFGLDRGERPDPAEG